MIKVEGLEYRYAKSKFALKNIAFTLEDGYLMCLVGRNGAGKTTLLQTLYGVLSLHNGEVSYNGIGVAKGKKQGKVSAKDLKDYRNEVAYVGNVTWFFVNSTMEENIRTLQALYPKFDEKEYQRLCTYFGLQEADTKKMHRELSAGQKMLFQLAFAMARHPRLLLLDEPFANLDPIVKVDLAQLFQDKLKEENMQIILSTHLVDDITDMVDYIGVLQDGELVRFGDRESVFAGQGAESLKEYILQGLPKEDVK